MKTLNNIATISGLVACAGFIIIFLVNIAWMVWPYHVQDYTNPITILNPEHVIHPGEVIRWDIDVVDYGTWPYTTTQEIVPTAGQTGCDYKLLQSYAGVMEQGRIKRINATNIVPPDFKPCRYHVRLITSYQVNPSRVVTIMKQTDDFNVI